MTDSERELPIYMGHLGLPEGQPQSELEIRSDRGVFSILVTVNGKTACITLPELPNQVRSDMFRVLRRIFRRNTIADLETAEKLVMSQIRQTEETQVALKASQKRSAFRAMIVQLLSAFS